jgi:bifunctional polynucleotide phosphatase/kinase
MMQRIDNVMADLGVPATVIMATASSRDADVHECRKPGTGMWTLFTSAYAGEVAPDTSASFYCGDAAGRGGLPTSPTRGTSNPDFSDSDKAFADAVGLRFITPDEFFGAPTFGRRGVVKGEGGVKGEPGATPTRERPPPRTVKEGVVRFLRDLGDAFRDANRFKR